MEKFNELRCPPVTSEIQTYPMSFTGMRMLESFSSFCLYDDVVNAAVSPVVKVKVGFLNKARPAGLISIAERSCPTAPIAFPMAMLFAVPWYLVEE